MIALLYAYLTRLGWRQPATHPNPPRAAYSPLTADVVAIPTPSVEQVMARVARQTLVAEIRRLRVENAELRADLADAKYREEHDGY